MRPPEYTCHGCGTKEMGRHVDCENYTIPDEWDIVRVTSQDGNHEEQYVRFRELFCELCSTQFIRQIPKNLGAKDGDS